MAIGRSSTHRKYLIVILMLGLVISLALTGGCVQGVPSSTTPATPTIIPSAIPQSSRPEPSTTSLVTASVPSISVRDASTLIQDNKNNPDFMIIDVRTADEFNSGHLANAVNIDYYSSDFKSNIAKLDRNKEYLIYCRTGVRGAAATQIMLDIGFTRVHNLTGGILEWTNAGYPTAK